MTVYEKLLIEASPSGTALCKEPSCCCKIEKGAVRLCSWDEHNQRENRHIQCVDKDRVVQAVKLYAGVGRIPGMETLDASDRAQAINFLHAIAHKDSVGMSDGLTYFEDQLHDPRTPEAQAGKKKRRVRKSPLTDAKGKKKTGKGCTWA